MFSDDSILQAMELQSRSSNRSNLPSNKNVRGLQSYSSDPDDIFNSSFYQQRVESSNQSFQSVQFMKKYMNETSLSVIIQKVMNIVLNLQKLPQNPFNLMYRLIHHQTIYQNLKRHYNQESEHQNFVNSNSEEEEEIDSNAQGQDVFIEVKMKEKHIYLTQRLSKYINMTNAHVFSKIVHSKRIVERYKQVCEALNIDQIHLSLGGALLLNLRGNQGNLDVPVKMPRQTAQKSIYCAESMLTITVYVQANRDILKAFGSYVDFILDDVRQSMQHKDENHTIYFQKLQVTNMDQIFSLIQFSREQMINSSVLVQKELLRCLQRQNVIIKSKSVYRLSKELIAIVGEEFVTVSKEYVLIAQENGLAALVSNSPLKYIFKEVFFDQKIIDMVSQNPQYNGSDMMGEYKKEMAYDLAYQLRMQNISYLIWEVFYYLIYENRTNKDNIQFVNEIQHTISYILLSPIAFVHKLQHSLRCVKWLTLPSFPTLSQNQTYAIIIALERDITAFIQRGNYIYWELEIFYQAIKLLLSIIVQFKQLKISAINFIVDHALLILDGVTTNFNHILLVLQGSLTKYINVMCQLMMFDQGSAEKAIYYDQYLKQKQMPSSVLRLNEEIKKIKKQFSMQESEVKTIILGKYVARYQFYQQIYQFYWNLTIGKKVMYPLSGFLKLLMINATQCNYEIFRDNYTKPKFKIESSVVNSVTIYQLSQVESSSCFYSLSSDSLQAQALKEYKTIMELIDPFLEVSLPSQSSLGFRYGSKITVESLNHSAFSKGNKKIVSIKSIDMGDNYAQQSSSFSVCKVLLDLIVTHNFLTKNELYAFALEQVNLVMSKLEGQNLSVVGLFSYCQNGYEASSYQQHLYSKLLVEDNCLRYDYKRKIQIDAFTKFIDYNLNQGRFIEIKAIYMVRDVTKVLKVSFNIYYQLKQTIASLFKPHYIHQRVFPNKKDIVDWCQLNHISQNKPTSDRTASSKTPFLISLKKLQEEKEVSITEILSDRDIGQHGTNPSAINKFKYYRQSPFYNLLRKVSETVEVMLTVVDFLKADRRGRYDLSHLQHLYQLLKYYLLERCIVKDDYIYSEGVCVSMVNLVMLLKDYFDKHPDNVGEEKQLLQFEKILRKLWGLIKYSEISCTICIHQSLNLFLKEQAEKGTSSD